MLYYLEFTLATCMHSKDKECEVSLNTIEFKLWYSESDDIHSLLRLFCHCKINKISCQDNDRKINVNYNSSDSLKLLFTFHLNAVLC